MTTVPCISLWQPYAWALVTGLKLDETRHFALPAQRIGQRTAIHAAKRRPPQRTSPAFETLMCDILGGDWRNRLTYGAVVGTVVWGSCRSTATASLGTPTTDAYANLLMGDWTPGRFAWRAEDPQLFLQPILTEGRQSWFNVDIPEGHA